MPKSKVVIIKSDNAFSNSGKTNPDVIAAMVNRGLTKLVGQMNSTDALALFFSKRDVIGMKANCLSGKMLSTHPEICFALANSLKKIGVKEENIIIWDRQNSELKEAGFPLNYSLSGIRCYGTDSDGVGYDRYGELRSFKNIGSLFSQIFSKRITALINLPVLKDHSLAGVSGGMKNLYGIIHNPNKYHENNCDPFVADLCSMPEVKEKNKLTICDCLRVQYNAGPSYHPQWAENYGGLIFGTDPVAVDFVGYQVIEKLRAKHNFPSLEKAGRKPKYIFTAADEEHKLGKASAGEIEIIEEKII
jgi:uncharacterized protein (DUF362 family)